MCFASYTVISAFIHILLHSDCDYDKYILLKYNAA